MKSFTEWFDIKEGANLGVYSKYNYRSEVMEDAEVAYNQVFKMASDPTHTERKGKIGKVTQPFSWMHYAIDYLTTNKNVFINGAVEKIMSKIFPGDTRGKGRKAAQNYIASELQKGPITRRMAEFGRSLGYSPPLTISPNTTAGSSQTFSSPQNISNTQQYFGLGVQKPVGKRNFKTSYK